MTGAIHLAMVQFNQPWWLVLLPPVAVLVVWLGRQSLSGLATAARRVALVVRLVVVGLLIAALAEPQWRREGKGVAVTVVLDASRSEPAATQGRAMEYLKAAAPTASADDLLGLVTAARDAYVQAVPGPILRDRPIDLQYIGAQDATNLESAARLAMAVMKPETANRMLVVSDGNETVGSLLSVAKAAKAAGIPIDVIPSRYSFDREVILDRLVAPATARQGEVVNLRAVLTATRPVEGRLTVTLNGLPVDLDPDSEGMAARVKLEAGTNVQVVPVAIPGTGPQRFEAVFEPLNADGTAMQGMRSENKRGLAVTFVGGEGRLLVLVNAENPAEADGVVASLRAVGIKSEVRPATAPFDSLGDLGQFEGVMLVNTPASQFTQQQQEELRTYVHDLGGGMMVVGGPEAFGAGGWIGSPLAEALPIKLDPPQKRQMPRGALALVMHSCEMPQGNYWGRRTAEAAVEALAAQDMAGIIEAGWGSGTAAWTHPLSILGDKSGIKRSIRNMNYGDTQSFADMLQLALTGMQKVAAGQKHVIIISDADPQPPSDALLQQFVASKVTISTVAVFPHVQGTVMSGDLQRMKRMADITGGNYHEVTKQDKLNSLPQIFIKEAQTVRRTLIWEGEAISPAIVGGQMDTLRGFTRLPPLTGYVVGAEREGLAQVVLRGVENDPIMAQWQHGLGRVITFTSDAGGRWTTAWTAWPQFRGFWGQSARWMMRPAQSPNVRVTTDDRGDKTRIVVEAVDDAGERLNFLRWQARAVNPDLSAQGLDLKQVGPGRYEGEVDTSASGAYALSMGFERFNPDGTSTRGSVQAAVTRPFADEFRALRDNAALLEQVAKETGGRVLRGDPLVDEPWSRAGLKRPVALLPVWLAVALSSIGLFLVDVGVRRVRIDLRAIWEGIVGLFKARKAKGAGAQIEALRGAKDKARKQIEGSASTRGVKFEADAGEMKAALKQKGPTIDTGAEGGTSAPVVEKHGPVADAKGGKAEEQGMSRLMKAKKRAQDEMTE